MPESIGTGGTVAYHLEVRMTPDGQVQDVLLDGESYWPSWFKVEWKGNGHLGAKIAGHRVSTREGDDVRFVIAESFPPAPSARRRRSEAGE